MADQTFPDNVTIQGNLGVGGPYVSTKKLNVGAQFNTDADNFGIYLDATQTAPSSKTLRGVASDFRYTGSGFLQGLNATDFTVHVGNGSSPSTVGFAKSFSTWGWLKNGATVQNLWMAHIEAPLLEGNASIGNLMGLRIGNMSAGSNSWAIYSQGGRCYFAGNVGVGVDNPLAPLHVRSPQGANLLVNGVPAFLELTAWDNNSQLIPLTLSATRVNIPSSLAVGTTATPSGPLHVRATNGVSFMARGVTDGGLQVMQFNTIDDGGFLRPLHVATSNIRLNADTFSFYIDPTGVRAGPFARPVINNIGEVLYS
jgi:hypothetical protein